MVSHGQEPPVLEGEPTSALTVALLSPENNGCIPSWRKHRKTSRRLGRWSWLQRPVTPAEGPAATEPLARNHTTQGAGVMPRRHALRPGTAGRAPDPALGF